MTYTPYIWPQLLAALLTAGAAIYAGRFHEVPAVRPFRCLMWQSAFWAISYSLQMLVDSFPVKIWLSKAQHASNIFLPFLVVCLVLEYLDRQQWLSRRRLIWLLLPHLVFLLLIVTSRYHTLWRYDYTPSPEGALAVVHYRIGSGQRLYTIINSIEIFTSLGLLIASFRSRRAYFHETALISFGIVAPFIVNNLFTLGFTPIRGYNFTPMGLAFTGGLYLYAFQRLNLFDLAPIARNLVLDVLRDLVIVINQHNRIVDFNRAAQQTCGLSPQHSIGVSAATLPAPWGVVFARLTVSDSQHEEITFGADAAARHYDVTILPIDDTRYQRRGRVLLFRDITERKQAEEELRKFSRAVEQSGSTIVITDINGDIEYVNPAFSKTTGYAREEALGQNPRLLKSGQMLPEVYVQLWQTISRGEVWQGDFLNKKKSGDLYWESATISPVKDVSGNITHYLSVQEDITEQKRLEEALRQSKEAAESANHAKSEFLANMSHELRTPLNAILGFTQLLARNRHMSDEEQANLGIIHRSGEHLLTLINQVLDLSKIEAGRITFNEKRFDLHQLLGDLRDMFSLKVQQKGLVLSVDIAPDVPRYVRTDEIKLRQVLINILNNAVKFTQEGGVTMRVRRERVRVPKKAEALTTTLLFEIEDTGAGIASEEMQDLFEAFAQTETGRQTQEGTGLGLPISRKFVQLMGGDITATSDIGHGTIFRFDIHATLVDETVTEKGLPPNRYPIALEPGQPHYRLLIVDDKPDNRTLLVKLLNPFGFELREATHGQEAIAIWNAWKPHLIWMDLRMPVMSGYDATQHIRAQFNGNDTIIIAVSASAFEEERDVALSKGCDDFLRKPFHDADIFELIQKHLGVQFVFEEEPLGAGSKESLPEQEGLIAKALAALSSDVLAQLEHAVTICDTMAIMHLVADIRLSDPSLADALTQLADNFEYSVILTAIQESQASPLTPQTLASLPEAWFRQLKQASETLDTDAIHQVITHIQQQHPRVADELAELMKQYRFDRLQELVTQAETER